MGRGQPFWTPWRRPLLSWTDGVREIEEKIEKKAFLADKHAQIFPEEENRAIRKAAFRQKAQSLDSAHHTTQQTSLYKPYKSALRVLEKAEYLRIFYDCLIWKGTKLVATVYMLIT